MRAPIPTINGSIVPTDDDVAYMEYLDELAGETAPDYGLLVFKGDPTAFTLGRDEWAGREPRDLDDD